MPEAPLTPKPRPEINKEPEQPKGEARIEQPKQPVSETEQKMADRIKTDGDPDQVLSNISLGSKPKRIGIDTETLQMLYGPEHLPIDRIQEAFQTEFGYLEPDINRMMQRLQGNSLLVSFVEGGHDLAGLTSPFYRGRGGSEWGHKIQVETGSSPDQDQHVLTHEWIHGLSLGEEGDSLQEGDVTKRVIHGRIGFKKMEAVVVRHSDGREEITEQRIATGTTASPEMDRVLEALTEWKARKLGIKYFPEKYSDFHASFTTGYQGASITEWLEEQASITGRQEEFTHAVDIALVRGDEKPFVATVNSLFPSKDAMGQVLETFRQEVALEQQVKQGQFSIDQADNKIKTELYPILVKNLRAGE